ncbi:MAG: hypothetical protein KDE22_13340, partial [Rhodobacterales bacterium]|nr:hypothetical protein [Rhodobacterales bacterium]
PPAMVPAPAAPVRLPVFGEANIALPPGGSVARMTAEGDRLFLHIDDPAGGGRVVVVDLTDGRTLGTLYLRP